MKTLKAKQNKINFGFSPSRGGNEYMSGAPNDRFLGNICSEPSRMAKIFESPRTAKNFENVSW